MTSTEITPEIARAMMAAVEGRECPTPIYPPLTAIGERLDAIFDTHCRYLTGRPKQKATAKPSPAEFVSRLSVEQRAYVMALPQHKLSRWGQKVRAALKAAMQEQQL